MTSNSRLRSASHGFTLLEILIAIAVLGLLTSVAVIALPAITDRAGVITTSAHLRDLADRGRTIARRTGDPSILTFPLGHMTLIAGGKTVDIPVDERVKVNVISAREANQGTVPSIIFLGDGTTTGVRVQFTSGHDVTTFTISWLTGGISQSD